MSAGGRSLQIFIRPSKTVTAKVMPGAMMDTRASAKGTSSPFITAKSGRALVIVNYHRYLARESCAQCSLRTAQLGRFETDNTVRNEAMKLLAGDACITLQQCFGISPQIRR